MSIEGLIAVYAALVATLVAAHQIYAYAKDRRFIRIDATKSSVTDSGEHIISYEVIVSNIGHRPVTLIECWWDAYKLRWGGLRKEYCRGSGITFEGYEDDEFIKLEPGDSVISNFHLSNMEGQWVRHQELPIRYISISHSQSTKPALKKIVLTKEEIREAQQVFKGVVLPL